MILYDDGTMWGCGLNWEGQLGLGHGCDAFMLTPLTEGGGPEGGGFWKRWCEDVGDFVRVACGADFTVAVTKEGRVVAAGLNTHGQLGQGNDRDGSIPAPVPALRLGGWRVECMASSTFAWLPSD